MTKNKTPREEGYSKVPNWIYDSNLSPYEIAVFTNLIRRADKNGESYPSLPRIGSDTGIKSENTVRKTIESLINRGLIFKVSAVVGGKTTYRVTQDVYRTIQNADAKYREKKEKAMQTTPSPDEGVPTSRHKSKPPHQMRTKEYTDKKNTVFKEDRANDNISRLRLNQILKQTPKPLFDSELDPRRKAKADADLEHIRAQNLLREQREQKVLDEHMY